MDSCNVSSFWGTPCKIMIYSLLDYMLKILNYYTKITILIFLLYSNWTQVWEMEIVSTSGYPTLSVITYNKSHARVSSLSVLCYETVIWCLYIYFNKIINWWRYIHWNLDKVLKCSLMLYYLVATIQKLVNQLGTSQDVPENFERL